MSLEPFTLPETAQFWDGAGDGKLKIQQCRQCNSHYFPPSPICPHCTSRHVAWITASGRARLYSFTISNAGWPHWKMDGPRSLAMVELEEGPVLLSTIVDIEQTIDALEIDMPLVATWRPFGNKPAMLCFAPANAEEPA